MDAGGALIKEERGPEVNESIPVGACIISSEKVVGAMLTAVVTLIEPNAEANAAALKSSKSRCVGTGAEHGNTNPVGNGAPHDSCNEAVGGQRRCLKQQGLLACIL